MLFTILIALNKRETSTRRDARGDKIKRCHRVETLITHVAEYSVEIVSEEQDIYSIT